MSGSALWLDGQLVPGDEAGVSPFDHGLLVGDGVFETLRVYDGVPFAWTRHHQRLVRSAGGLGLTAPGSQELRAAVDDVLAANDLNEGRVRLTITGGPSPLGSERGDGLHRSSAANSATGSTAWSHVRRRVRLTW